MAMITSEEVDLIGTLRSNVEDMLEKDEHKKDSFLVRWIRARDNDLERAEELLRNSLQWRKENEIDSLMSMELEQIYFDKFPRKTECHDKGGRPVITVPFGRWDIPFSAATDESVEGFRLYTLQGCEQLMDEIRKAQAKKEDATQCVLLIDMAGFSFMNLMNVYAVQNGLALLAIYEANYPESLHSCFLINSSGMINMLLSLVRPVLATKTYEKIKVFGCNVDEWQSALLEIIDADQLPVEFGGTKDEEEAEEAEEADEEFQDSREEVD